MFRPWTARIVLVALTLEVGLLCSLYTDDLSLLRRGEEGIFATVLSWVRHTDPREVILESSPEVEGWSLRPLDGGVAIPFDWSLVEVPDVPELFDGDVPSPAEYAVLLSKLHQAGTREVAFTEGLSWETAPEIELVAMESALQPFGGILLPLAFSEVPNPSSPPAWLQPSLIPGSVLIGDASSLPIVNQISFPSAVAGSEQVTFSFADFGSRDLQFRNEQRIPLLARWGSDFIPSWSLQMAMYTLGLAPGDLVIEPGRFLRLGPDGPVIPIDDFGRAKLADGASPLEPLPQVSAKTLFPLSEGDLPEMDERVVLMSSLTPRSSERSRRLIQEARSLLAFPRPGAPEVFRRLPRAWEVVLYLEVALVGIFALHVRSPAQAITLVILCGGLSLFVVGLLNWKGLWTPILPLVAAISVSWCLIGYLQQIAHPVVRRKKKGSLKQPEPI